MMILQADEWVRSEASNDNLPGINANFHEAGVVLVLFESLIQRKLEEGVLLCSLVEDLECQTSAPRLSCDVRHLHPTILLPPFLLLR